jgi:TetR/AcrR family transcriptional regulator, repressor for neighboring sulfatase
MATAVKRPTGRDEVVDAVLDAAELLFAASGPADVSLRAIAREADVNYGLVHRHFGTKDDVFDQLLERYARRWGAQLEAAPDYPAALDRLFGPGVDTGLYLRLLAWTLLSDRAKEPAAAPKRHATLDRLLDLEHVPEAGDPTVTTAAALALAFGWRFFNPFIRDALHVDDERSAEFHESVRRRLHDLIDG